MSDLSFSSERGGDGFNWLQLAVNLAVLSDTPDPQVQEGRRLSSLQLLTARPGQPMTRIYGRMRVGGHIIWRGSVREHVSEQGGDDGDKGGGSATPRRRSYRYSMHLAIGLCEGPVSHVGRIWADGRLLDNQQLNVTLHHGRQDAAPDPLIEAAMGVGRTPAFRGLAYIVLRDFDLTAFGNRVPQLSFEVFKPVGAEQLTPPAVCLLPGANEFAYHPEPHIRYLGPGRAVGENITVNAAQSDWDISLDQLQEIHPGCDAVALVVSWFGTDLRADKCRIMPKVDNRQKQTLPSFWSVAGIERHAAAQVSMVDGRPAFGGTPSDDAVIAAIRDLTQRGLKITFYPFIMMDIAPDNNLPNFAGAIGQPAFPWRGHITADRPPNKQDEPVATRLLSDLMEKFIDGHKGEERFSLRGMILHYARLCAQAGGVEAFLIGSELRGMSRLCDRRGRYPFADKLSELAAEIRQILPDSKISYAADWSEYGAHIGSNNHIGFPLDAFWGDENCDFVGIDNYLPLADWRDGTQHEDAAQANDIYDLDYLQANVRGGEYFDWYYENAAARNAQQRTPIPPHNHAWRFRAKDLLGWWENTHIIERNGKRVNATSWQPRSKPIWFTELGCPAVDKGANQPNVFPDARSADGGLPYFSDGSRDDLMQLAYFRAMQGFYEKSENNPISLIYGGAMVDASRIFYWAWDARPFPAFPYRLDVWRDGDNWHSGHWLNGRNAGAPLATLLRALGGRGLQTENIRGHVEGYALRGISHAAQDITPLLTAFGIDAGPQDKSMRLRGRADRSVRDIASDDLLPLADGTIGPLRGHKAADKLPKRFDLHFLDAAGDYGASHVSARFEGGEQPVARLNLPVAMGRSMAQALATRLLHGLRGEHETVSLRLPPSYLDLEVGDIIRLDGLLWRINELIHGRFLEVSAVRHQAHLFGGYGVAQGEEAPPHIGGQIARPEVNILELPAPALRFHNGTIDAPLVAAFAAPWPQNVHMRQGSAAPLVIAAPSIMGETIDDFPAMPIGRWQRGASLSISLYGGTLASILEREVLAGGNRLAIETEAGWEIIQFAKAELIAERHYRLTDLLRAQFGSDAAQVALLPKGARCLILGSAQVPLSTALENLPAHFAFHFGPPNLPQDSYGWQRGEYHLRRTARMCLSPVHGKIAWPHGKAGNWHITWVRRSRMGGDDFDAAITPLGEDAEGYRISLTADGVAVHAWESDSADFVLSTKTRRKQRAVHRNIENWGLQIAQINSRGEAGAPLHIPLTMNEESR